MIFTRRFLATTLLVATITAGIMSLPAFAAKNYYKWTDKEGVTHYTARKPHNTEVEAISVSTGLPRDSSGQPIQVEDEAPASAAETQAAADPEANKDPERCEAATKNLKIINENARIRERTEDGSTRFLTQEEIKQRKEQAQQAIDESC